MGAGAAGVVAEDTGRQPNCGDGLQAVPVHSIPTLASIRKKRSLRRWASLRWVL